jgi:hypothetical protein
MLGDERLQHPLASRLERGERVHLAGFHSPSMADNIGGKDGSEATFGGRLPWQDRYDRQILGPGRSNGESGNSSDR